MFVALVLAVTSSRSLLAAPADSVSFKVDAQTVVPGAVLAPGSYTLHIVNSLSDRVVLKIDGHGVHTTFLGVEDKALLGAGSGLMLWSSPADGVTYARGLSLESLPAPVQFVYPKDDAVKIAQANPARVPAVDPASEGKPTDSTISQKDMTLLNLWLLHVDRVGNEGGGVKAEHYMPIVAVKTRPVVAALPHTGSMMPLVWGAGALSLLGACVLRVTRRKRAVDVAASA
jgi:hypothetical protein